VVAGRARGGGQPFDEGIDVGVVDVGHLRGEQAVLVTVRYVTDVHDAAAKARAAAGDADVVAMGAGAGQALLRAGELDELELHIVPVLLGQGRLLFDNL